MTRLANDYSKWTENIEVSVWGKGKATLVDKTVCVDDSLTGNQKYKGNCDECKYFMGIQTDGVETATWGDRFKGCCGKLIK